MAETDQDAASIIADEELELDLELDVDDSEEVVTLKKGDYEKLSKRANAVPNILARAKKAEAQAKATHIKKEETHQESQKPSDILKADEFKLYRQGYTESEIDLIMHNGGMKALTDEKSPLALGLKVSREQRQAEEAASQTSDTVGLSELERKFTPEQMRNMPKEELEKLIGFAQ